MKIVELDEASERLTELCEEVATTGAPILIAKEGRPMVRITRSLEGEAAPSAPGIWDAVREWEREHGAVEDELILPERYDTDRDPLSDY